MEITTLQYLLSTRQKQGEELNSSNVTHRYNPDKDVEFQSQEHSLTGNHTLITNGFLFFPYLKYTSFSEGKHPTPIVPNSFFIAYRNSTSENGLEFE